MGESLFIEMPYTHKGKGCPTPLDHLQGVHLCSIGREPTGC